MPNGTLSEETTAINFWRWPGSVGKIRVFSLQAFRTVDGQFVPQGNPANKNSCHAEVNFVVNANKSLSIEATSNIPFTTNSPNVPTARFTALMYDARDVQRQVWLENFNVSASLGPTFTWAQLEDSQGRILPNPPSTTLSREQILDYISGLPPAVKMTTVINGIATLLEAADDSVSPKVLGPNSAFIRSLRTQAKGVLGSTNKIGTTTKLTDGNKGFVYDNGTNFTRANLGVYHVLDQTGARDNDSADNTTAIRAAITAAVAEGGGVVWFGYTSSGAYRITDDITVPSNIILAGESGLLDARIRIKQMTSGKACFKLVENTFGVTFRNLELLGGVSTAHGVLMTGSNTAQPCQYVHFEHVTIKNMAKCIYVNATDVAESWQASYVSMDHVLLQGDTCLHLNSLNFDGIFNDVAFLSNTDGFNVDIEGSGPLQFNHCYFLGNNPGASCVLGVPNVVFAEAAFRVRGAHGPIHIINGQGEGCRNSMVKSVATQGQPITVESSIMGAPWLLQDDTDFICEGSIFYANSIQATGDTSIDGSMNGIIPTDECGTPDLVNKGVILSGNAKLVQWTTKDGIAMQKRLNLGNLTILDTTDPSLPTTPTIQIARDDIGAALMFLGMSAAGVATNGGTWIRTADGFLGLLFNQEIPNRGFRINGPMKFSGTSAVNLSDAARTITDVGCTNGSPNITSVSASFTTADIGKIGTISGGSTVPNGTTIIRVLTSSSAVLSSNVTTTGINRTLVIQGNAVLNYDPVANLTQLSENGAAFTNLLKAATALTTNRSLRVTDGATAAVGNGLWSDDGTNMQLVSGLLRLLGATSSFPALKRVSTGIEIRLADDSGQAPLSALSLSLGGGAALDTTAQTGTGNLVRANAPTLTAPVLTTPVLGAATATSLGIGTGTTITKIVRNTVTVNPASINANTVSSQTFTFTGAVVGDSVAMNPPAAGLTTGLIVLQCFISAADTVTIVFQNTTGAPIDEPSANWNGLLVRS